MTYLRTLNEKAEEPVPVLAVAGSDVLGACGAVVAAAPLGAVVVPKVKPTLPVGVGEEVEGKLKLKPAGAVVVTGVVTGVVAGAGTGLVGGT
jgi:hypothetical protein